MTTFDETTTPTAQQHRILIADDRAAFLRTTGDLLRKAGYDCVCVCDAEEAIVRLQNEQFDLVLSDLNMPGNLKMELLHYHARCHAPIPIIVVTGDPSLPTAIESIRLGIKDYLLKPLNFEELLTSVRRALDTSSANPHAEQTVASSASSRRVELSSRTIGRGRQINEPSETTDGTATTDTNVLVSGEPEISTVEESANLDPSATRQQAMRQAESEYLTNLIANHGGNVSEAARQAGLSRQGLHKLLKAHGIQASDFR
ncbi:MAG: response regulator [Pirellulaceae bacterium]